jgi:LemA protein
MRSSGPREASKAEGALTAALGDLRAMTAGFPELWASDGFQQLSRSLSELDDDIQAARRIYNSNVHAYNAKIRIFPNSIVANPGGFEPRAFFEIEVPGELAVPPPRSSNPRRTPAE